jgi:hypothetical protein
LIIAFAIACNDSNTKDTNAMKLAGDNGIPYKWSEEDEKEFLSDCIENTGEKMDEAASFANCKCVLDQLKRSFPNLDSAATVLIDTTRAAEFAARCK